MALLICSASFWYNQIPISLFLRPKTLIFMILGFLDVSRAPETNIIYLWRDPDTLNKSRKIWEHHGKTLSLEIGDPKYSKIFEIVCT